MANWKITITPSPEAGDGAIRLDLDKPSASIVEDHREISFSAGSQEELIAAVASFGLMTGKLNREEIHEMIDYLDATQDAPAGSENWSLEQWQRYAENLEIAVEEVRANPEHYRVGSDGLTEEQREFSK